MVDDSAVFKASLRLIFAVVVISAGVSSAQAASWAGPYGGVEAGVVVGEYKAETSTIFSPTGYFATSSVPAIASLGSQKMTPVKPGIGGQLGYNFEFGRLVTGGELDLSTGARGSKGGTAVYPCCAPTSFSMSQAVDTNWVLSLRPRLGYSFGNWMAYGTAGVSLAHITYTSIFTDTFATANEGTAISKNKVGWVAGAGAEMKLQNQWSLRGEYLYDDSGKISGTSTNLRAFTPPIAFPSNVFSHSAKVSSHTVHLVLNYHF